jgi:hypothetical protein
MLLWNIYYCIVILREEKSLRSLRALTTFQYLFLSIDAAHCDCDVEACECCFQKGASFLLIEKLALLILF